MSLACEDAPFEMCSILAIQAPDLCDASLFDIKHIKEARRQLLP